MLLQGAEDRGVFFIKPGTKVYGGMIIGENSSPARFRYKYLQSQKINQYAQLQAAKYWSHCKRQLKWGLERCLEYIQADELVEVTPQSIRMRKRQLSRK